MHVQYPEESPTPKIKLLQLVLRDVHLLNATAFAQGQKLKLVALQINKFETAIVLEAEFFELVISQPQFLNNIGLAHPEATQTVIIQLNTFDTAIPSQLESSQSIGRHIDLHQTVIATDAES